VPPRFRAADSVGAALLAVLLAACGSRLPESDFTSRPATPPASTAAPIRVGIVASATGPVGGAALTAPRDGALAYLARLNAAGGVGGRRVEAVTCDDGGSGAGNTECVRRLIGQRKVFALLATSVLDYAGAPYVSRSGVPDVGGIPVGTAYDTYPHLYSLYGSIAPRRGTVGWGGTLYTGTEVYRWFKEKLKARTAAVVYYNQSDSARYADQLLHGLRAEGYRTVREEVDFALPNFDAVAADLRARGVDVLFDAMDTTGNSRLCGTMQAAGVTVAAKVANVQNWTSAVPADYADATGCRHALWATGTSRNHDDTSVAAVRAFRAGMAAWQRRHDPRNTGRFAQWQLEGWAAAAWLTDALRRCGPMRGCVERFITGRSGTDDTHGLLVPPDFRTRLRPPAVRRACLSVARWSDQALGGRGGWVTRGDALRGNCFTVPQIPYRP
jgi:ABC-type branched-subunit amino acid transport system substrate-binding protein